MVAVVGLPLSILTLTEVTALLSLAVPLTVKVPVFKKALLAGLVIETVGALVSTVNVLPADAGDVLPAASVAVAVIVCEP